MKLPSFTSLSLLDRRLCAGLILGVVGQALPLLVRAPLPLPRELAWLLDLGTHWQILWLVLSVGCATWLCVRHRSVMPATLAFAGICFVWFATPSMLRHAQGPHEGLTVVTANLHFETTDLGALAEWIKSKDPDIVVLEEVSPAAAAELKTWKQFSSQSIVAADDPFGMAFLAKADHVAVDWVTNEGTPQVRAQVPFGNTVISVYGIHPMPPIAPEHHVARGDVLARIKMIARHAGTPSLVMGDFNASPWSSAMPSDVFYRTMTPWPTWMHVLPIDHILGSRHFEVMAAGVGPNIGSDHRPVWATLAVVQRAIRPTSALQAQGTGEATVPPELPGS